MAVLWELGSGSTREIHARVGEPDDLAYTTTAKVLDRLHAKGLVTRERAGKRFVYRPKGRREVVERARFRHALRNLIGGEARPAMATLVDALTAIDRDLLDELARVVEARRRKRRGS